LKPPENKEATFFSVSKRKRKISTDYTQAIMPYKSMGFKSNSQRIVEKVPVIHNWKEGRNSVISTQIVDKLWKKKNENHKVSQKKQLICSGNSRADRACGSQVQVQQSPVKNPAGVYDGACRILLLFLCSIRVKLLTGAARIMRYNQHAMLF